jgi:hypothetical protein
MRAGNGPTAPGVVARLEPPELTVLARKSLLYKINTGRRLCRC